jgi:hypothetical protein
LQPHRKFYRREPQFNGCCSKVRRLILFDVQGDPQDSHWVLPVYRYKEPEQLLRTLGDVIAPAEEKAKAMEKALEERRRMFEAELTKPQ